MGGECSALYMRAWRKTPTGHQKVLQDIDRLLTEAPDEASRHDLDRLRDSLNSPQMLDMAREVMSKPRSPGTIWCSNSTTRCCRRS